MPVKWGTDNNLVWQDTLPGPGASSPMVVGDRVFLTCYSGYGIETGNDDSRASASPAIHNEQILLGTDCRLYCIGKK